MVTDNVALVESVSLARSLGRSLTNLYICEMLGCKSILILFQLYRCRKEDFSSARGCELCGNRFPLIQVHGSRDKIVTKYPIDADVHGAYRGIWVKIRNILSGLSKYQRDWTVIKKWTNDTVFWGGIRVSIILLYVYETSLPPLIPIRDKYLISTKKARNNI